jgi:hypothetical protein
VRIDAEVFEDMKKMSDIITDTNGHRPHIATRLYELTDLSDEARSEALKWINKYAENDGADTEKDVMPDVTAYAKKEGLQFDEWGQLWTVW